MPEEDDPARWPVEWVHFHDLTEPPQLAVEVTEAEVIAQLLGPDGEVISEMFDREVGTFGFTKDPWSTTWRY